jgi:hypothetical protein
MVSAALNCWHRHSARSLPAQRRAAVRVSSMALAFTDVEFMRHEVAVKWVPHTAERLTR